MEPGGPNPTGNRLANHVAPKTAEHAKTVVVRCDRLPLKCHGKERGSTVRAFASAGTG
jgi:hypothetical protein